jgi:hypothetical protein
MSKDFDGLRRDRQAESRAFSWRKAIGHAAAAVAVVLVIGIVVAAVADLQNPRAVGRAIGSTLPVVAGAALLLSYLAQRGSRGALVGVLVLTVVLVVAAVAGLGHVGGPRALSAAERAPLLIDGEGASRRLRHPSLGFSVALPEDLAPLPASVTEAMSKDPGVTGTAWGNAASGRVLMVLLATVRSEADLRSFMDGVTDSQDALARQAGGGATVDVVRDELHWSGTSGEAHRHVTIGGAHARFDAYGGLYGKDRVLTVGVFTFSRSDDSFADLAATLQRH